MSYWQRWVQLLDRQESALPLALVRMAASLIVLLHVSRIWMRGIHLWAWVDDDFGGLRNLNAGFLERFGGLSPENVQMVMATTIVAAVAMFLGIGTRVACLVTALGYGYLADINGHAGGSYDELVKNTLFLLVLSGCGRALSLDERIRPTDGQAMAWPRWLMIFQLVLMYWMTALQKVSSSWVPIAESDALFYILQQTTWQRFPLPLESLTTIYPITRLATFTVWTWEQCAPLLLLAYWFRETHTRPGRLRALFNRYDFRSIYLLFGLGMHLGIEGLMEVGPFSFASLTLYFACFHPDEWSRLRQRLLPARGSGR